MDKTGSGKGKKSSHPQLFGRASLKFVVVAGDSREGLLSAGSPCSGRRLRSARVQLNKWG